MKSVESSQAKADNISVNSEAYATLARVVEKAADIGRDCSTIAIQLFDVLKDPENAIEYRELAADRISTVATPRKHFGTIRDLLKEQNMTQTELAELLGVSPSVICRILGRPERAKLSTLQRIAMALRVPLARIIPS